VASVVAGAEASDAAGRITAVLHLMIRGETLEARPAVGSVNRDWNGFVGGGEGLRRQKTEIC
jgi:hypothetical protein